jgi:hypothetical protein
MSYAHNAQVGACGNTSFAYERPDSPFLSLNDDEDGFSTQTAGFILVNPPR